MDEAFIPILQPQLNNKDLIYRTKAQFLANKLYCMFFPFLLQSYTTRELFLYYDSKFLVFPPTLISLKINLLYLGTLLLR